MQRPWGRNLLTLFKGPLWLERGRRGGELESKTNQPRWGDLGTWAIVRTLSLTLNEVEPVEGFD